MTQINTLFEDSIPLLYRVASWLPQSDFLTISTNGVKRLSRELGAEKTDILKLAMAHELREGMYYTSQPLLNILYLHLKLCEVIATFDNDNYYLTSLINDKITLKRYILTLRIVAKRIMQDYWPLMQALSVFEAEYFEWIPEETKLIRKIKRRTLITPSDRIYKKLMWLFKKSKSGFLPHMIVRIALEYPNVNDLTTFLWAIPFDYSPQQRFENLMIALEVMNERKALWKEEAIKAAPPDPYYSVRESPPRLLLSHEISPLIDWLVKVCRIAGVKVKYEPFSKRISSEYCDRDFLLNEYQELFSHHLYRIFMKPRLKLLKKLIENPSGKIENYEAYDCMSTFLAFIDESKNKIIFFKVRDDLTEREKRIACGYLSLTYLASQIEKQIDKNKVNCFFSDFRLNMCTRSCSSCAISRFIKNMEKIADLYNSSEEPELEYLLDELTKQRPLENS